MAPSVSKGSYFERAFLRWVLCELARYLSLVGQRKQGYEKMCAVGTSFAGACYVEPVCAPECFAMSETGSDACPDDAVARQHVQIKGLLESLHSRFESGRELNQHLVSLLNSLTSHLESHFELEEDGYYAELVQIAPRLSGQVDALIKEHSLFLDESRELAAMAQEAFVDSLEAPELAERFERFRRELLAHEREETSLLQEVYTRDIGEKD